jgi:hypothetical protein
MWLDLAAMDGPISWSTHLGRKRIFMDHLDHVKKDVSIRIPGGHITQTSHQPVGDARRSFGIRPEKQELLKQRVGKHSNELGGQFDLGQVLDERFGAVDLFQSD